MLCGEHGLGDALRVIGRDFTVGVVVSLANSAETFCRKRDCADRQGPTSHDPSFAAFARDNGTQANLLNVQKEGSQSLGALSSTTSGTSAPTMGSGHALGTQ
jgi:hypothetical protein